LIDSCEDFVLLQYDNHLELWKLGQTSDEPNLDEKKDGDCLPILRSPRKYLHLKSKNDLHIVCSSLGAHPNNRKSNNNHILWLSYSDLNVIHIYKIEICSKQVLEPKINIEKIKSLPLACGNRPGVIMKFFNYDENNVKMLRLCYITNKSCLQCLKLINEDMGFMLECSIQCVQQGLIFNLFLGILLYRQCNCPFVHFSKTVV